MKSCFPKYAGVDKVSLAHFQNGKNKSRFFIVSDEPRLRPLWCSPDAETVYLLTYRPSGVDAVELFSSKQNLRVVGFRYSTALRQITGVESVMQNVKGISDENVF